MSERDSKLSAYLLDVSKILFASSVVGFFIPNASGEVTFAIFIAGAICAVAFLVIGLAILPDKP